MAWRRAVRGLRSACLAGLLTSAAHAASFDCHKAVHPEDQAICADSKLNALDDRMAATYRAGLAKLSATAAEQTRNDQRLWLAWLGTVCRTATETDRAKLTSCLTTAYADRVAALKIAVRPRDSLVVYTRYAYFAAADAPDDGSAPSEPFPGFGTFSASWPQVDSTTSAWIAWNTAVERWADRGDDSNGALSNADAQGGDTEMVATLETITPRLIALLLAEDSMGHGAAHPNEGSARIYWLRRERRELAATDVFRGTAWRNVLAHECWTIALATDKESLFIQTPEDDALLGVVASSKNWKFTPKGLAISFPEYAISPRAFPIDDITVPWAVLRRHLAAGSPVGRSRPDLRRSGQ